MRKRKTKLKVVDGQAADGRRQRSQRSRQKILAAMWDLMLGGDMEPSAADIAQKAGVGLRSVFRHFEDMETIHRELLLLAEAKVAPLFMRPFKAQDWKNQLLELVARTVELWDPLRVPHTAAEIRRFKSKILMDDYKRARIKEFSSIQGVLPRNLPNYNSLLMALDTILCFTTVRRLREDRGLSVEETKAVMTHMVEALIKDLP